MTLPTIPPAIAVDLVAVLVAVRGDQPMVMTLQDGEALPAGPFELGHRSLQSGVRTWVEAQTGHRLGYLEQLYTFADGDRTPDDAAARVISISYLALTCADPATEANTEPDPGGWRGWYGYFPWEDQRAGPSPVIAQRIAPALQAWIDSAPDGETGRRRHQRSAISFGLDSHPWNEELVLQRYELLFEAGLVPEARRRRLAPDLLTRPGRAMIADHRRILATGIARLRAKIKYRPVVFELLPPTFTLLHLQRCVEALAGRLLHKQNFRRLIEQQDLVEETGETTTQTGGRPAKLVRFRHAVLSERAVVGTKLPLARS